MMSKPRQNTETFVNIPWAWHLVNWTTKSQSLVVEVEWTWAVHQVSWPWCWPDPARSPCPPLSSAESSRAGSPSPTPVPGHPLGATSALLMSPSNLGMHLSKFHVNLCPLESAASCPAVCQVVNMREQKRCSKWFHTRRKWQTLCLAPHGGCSLAGQCLSLWMGRVRCLWAMMALIKIGNSGSPAGPKAAWWDVTVTAWVQKPLIPFPACFSGNRSLAKSGTYSKIPSCPGTFALIKQK